MPGFIIFKEVATLAWPGVGMYRARFFAGTELHGEWSDKAAAEQVANMANAAGYERVDQDRWEDAKAGRLNGWCETSDAGAKVHLQPLSEAGRDSWDRHEAALEAYRGRR